MAPSEDNKKRKRSANAADSSSKKGLKVSHHNAQALHPVLASAPGLTTPDLAFTAYSKSRSANSSSDDAPTPKTHDLILQSSQHPRLDYTATPSENTQSHYIAVFDPSTNSLQVTPAHHLALRSTLRAEVQEVANEETKRRTYAQQREDLGKEFGTKKAKKALQSKVENAIVKDGGNNGKGKVDNVQTAVLENAAVAGANAPRKEEVDQAQLDAKPIPRPNLSADSVDQVYSFSTLIPPHDARLLQVKEWQDATREETPIMFSHRYPAHRVEEIGKSDNVQRLQALKYLTLLLEFHDALQNAGKTGKKVPKKDVLATKLPTERWPTALVDSVRRRFSTAANELPKWNMENLYTHMCALTLYIDGWTTNTTNLKDDLRMENKVLARYFLELGCKVAAPTEREREMATVGNKKMSKAQAAVTRIAKLKLPIEFPKARIARRK